MPKPKSVSSNVVFITIIVIIIIFLIASLLSLFDQVPHYGYYESGYNSGNCTIVNCTVKEGDKVELDLAITVNNITYNKWYTEYCQTDNCHCSVGNNITCWYQNQNVSHTLTGENMNSYSYEYFSVSITSIICLIIGVSLLCIIMIGLIVWYIFSKRHNINVYVNQCL